MDSSRYFTITLSSSDRSFEENSLADFKTFLGKEKILDGHWVVGLSEMHYTKSWYNVNEDHQVQIIDNFGNTFVSTKKVEAGFYESETALISVITSCIKDCEGKIKDSLVRLRKDSKVAPTIVLPALTHQQRARRITMTSGSGPNSLKLFLILPRELEEMLGIMNEQNAYQVDNIDNVEYSVQGSSSVQVVTPKTSKPSKRKTSTKIRIVSDIIKGNEDGFNCYDLNSGIHSLFIYCSLIDSVIVGNSFAPLLRAIPVQNKKFGDQCHMVYTKPYFYPLATNSFQTIHTSIRDKTGKHIPFKFGETTIVLEFKKI